MTNGAEVHLLTNTQSTGNDQCDDVHTINTYAIPRPTATACASHHLMSSASHRVMASASLEGFHHESDETTTLIKTTECDHQGV